MPNTNRGILLMNLGSPDDTSRASVKRYLDEFLMDERVIDKNYLLRLLLVKGIITPLRAGKSAEAYETIWQKEGSPLINITRLLQEALQDKTSDPVAISMRYGNPSAQHGFEELLKANPGLEEVIAVPLYPHYAMSSYETAVAHAKEVHEKNGYTFSLKFVEPYYSDSNYIASLAGVIKPYLQKEYDHILFSYHGIPARHIHKTDVTDSHCLQVNDCCNVPSPTHKYCYRHQCFTTTRLVTEALKIPSNKFSVSFQSRLGKGWLQPFTDIRLKEMPKEGIKKILVICPAFVSDCLETLEEIAIRGKEEFMEAGGETYEMIPCLNVNEKWVDTLLTLTETHAFKDVIIKR